MSIEEQLHEIQHALNQARTWLDCTEALVKQLVMQEKPTLEVLARAFASAEQGAPAPTEAQTVQLLPGDTP